MTEKTCRTVDDVEIFDEAFRQLESLVNLLCQGKPGSDFEAVLNLLDPIREKFAQFREAQAGK